MSCYVGHESQIGSYLQESAWLVQLIQTGWQFLHFHFFIQNQTHAKPTQKTQEHLRAIGQNTTANSPAKLYFFSVGIVFSLLDLFLSKTESAKNKPSIKYNASLTSEQLFHFNA